MESLSWMNTLPQITSSSYDLIFFKVPKPLKPHTHLDIFPNLLSPFSHSYLWYISCIHMLWSTIYINWQSYIYSSSLRSLCKHSCIFVNTQSVNYSITCPIGSFRYPFPHRFIHYFIEITQFKWSELSGSHPTVCNRV